MSASARPTRRGQSRPRPTQGKTQGKTRGGTASRAPWRWPRHRQVLVGAAVFAGVVLGTSFPLGTVLHQRQQVAATTQAIERLRRVDQRLAAEVQDLENPTVARTLAERELEGGAPAASGTTTGQRPPGLQLGAPALDPLDGGALAAFGLAPVTPPGARAPHADPGSAEGGFVARVLRTLEFWR